MAVLPKREITRLLHECTSAGAQSSDYLRCLGLHSVSKSKSSSGVQVFTGVAQDFNKATQKEVDRLANQYSSRKELQDAVLANRENIGVVTKSSLTEFGSKLWVNGHLDNTFILTCDEFYPRHLIYDDLDQIRIMVYVFCWIVRRACRKLEDAKRSPRATTEDGAIDIPSTRESSQVSQTSQPSQSVSSSEPQALPAPGVPTEKTLISQERPHIATTTTAQTKVFAPTGGIYTEKRGKNINIPQIFGASDACMLPQQEVAKDSGPHLPVPHSNARGEQKLQTHDTEPAQSSAGTSQDRSVGVAQSYTVPNDVTHVDHPQCVSAPRKRQLSINRDDKIRANCTATQKIDGATSTQRHKLNKAPSSSSRVYRYIANTRLNQEQQGESGATQNICGQQVGSAARDRPIHASISGSHNAPCVNTDKAAPDRKGTSPKLQDRIARIAINIDRHRNSLARELEKLKPDAQRAGAIEDITRLTKALIGTDSTRLRHVLGDEFNSCERVLRQWLTLATILKDFQTKSGFYGSDQGWNRHMSGLKGADRPVARGAFLEAGDNAKAWWLNRGDAFNLREFSREVARVLIAMADWMDTFDRNDEKEFNEVLVSFNVSLLTWFRAGSNIH